METAMEEVQTTATTTIATTTTTTTTTGDPESGHTEEEEGGFPPQMGSGRRDARVVCETFTGRDFISGKASNSRHMHSSFKDTQKNSKHMKRRGVAYSHSRNPLLACFVGESVLTSRAIRLNPNCDSANSQRAFFSLIPVDNSRVNERTGEPSSPQLSCIGQVKCRQAKAPRGAVAAAGAGAGTVVDDLPQLDLACEGKEASGATGAGLGKFGNRKSLGRATSLDIAAADIPPLDLNESGDCPRLMRSVKRPGIIDFSSSKKGAECERQQSGPMSPTSTTTGAKHSIQHINHLVKQLLGASMIKTGFICGWNSRDPTHGDGACEPVDDGRGEAVAEHYEIDLSRFASCDIQANTPSFIESKHQTGKKLADIRVCSQQQLASTASAKEDSSDVQVAKDDKSSPLEFTKSNHSTIVIKVERQKSSEATLWKRRCMDRPLSLEVKR